MEVSKVEIGGRLPAKNSRFRKYISHLSLGRGTGSSAVPSCTEVSPRPVAWFLCRLREGMDTFWVRGGE